MAGFGVGVAGLAGAGAGEGGAGWTGTCSVLEPLQPMCELTTVAVEACYTWQVAGARCGGQGDTRGTD